MTYDNGPIPSWVFPLIEQHGGEKVEELKGQFRRFWEGDSNAIKITPEIVVDVCKQYASS